MLTSGTSSEILLIEDSHTDARLFTRAVKRADKSIHVTWLEDGDKALEYINDLIHNHYAIPGIVVLDIKLGSMKGFEVLGHIRRNPMTEHLPVVMLSSSTQQEDIRLAYELGANSYLSKPASYASLTSLVHSLVSYWLQTNTSLHNLN